MRVQFSSRVVLQLAKGTTLGQALRESPLKPDREFAPNLFILQAPNVKVALEESQRLAKSPDVLVSHPVRRRSMRKTAPMAKRPNDPLYPTQWPLENRDLATGDRLGPEFNIREAWVESTGQGVVIGVADGKVAVVAAANDLAQERGVSAGDLVRAVAPLLGGKGGGKADVAQGGGSDASRVDEALARVSTEVGRAVGA